MILIGLGANLPSPAYGAPRQTLAAALWALEERGISVSGCSKWYVTAPVPVSDQPDFVNIVVAVDTDLEPGELLEQLHALEESFGRVRTQRNAARVLDIDLLDYNGQVSTEWPVMPHPRMDKRAFVLVPLRDIAPDWCHPVSGRTLDELLAGAPDIGGMRVLDA
jgi:2-amino-4-hydroxy-6-hydroxymethyldihydropteridine diphosphokinase